MNAIFYLDKAGCHWRLLPKDFPPWQTVYDHWRRWNQRGVWERALDPLNAAHRKKTAGRATPSYGLVDSQGVKVAYASEGRGYDGNQKTKGRKRHVVVDTLGNLIQVLVHAANGHDTKAGCDVLKAAADKHAPLEAFSGDAGYRGTAVEFVETALKLKLHISQKIKDAFAALPTRWVVERTFAWLGNYRRLSKDFEILTQSAENMVWIAMIQITLAKCV